MLLLDTPLLDFLGNNFIIALMSSGATLLTGYIILRERLLKTEMKLENVYDYIDNRNQITESKIQNLQGDISEFKEINKETTKSLAENTAAIKELKIVLSMVTDRLQRN